MTCTKFRVTKHL